jgi:hypothetical protein
MSRSSESEFGLPEDYFNTRPLIKTFLDKEKQVTSRLAWISDVRNQSNLVRSELQDKLGYDGWDNIVRDNHTNLVDRGLLDRTKLEIPKRQLQFTEILLTVGYQMDDPEIRKEFIYLRPLRERLLCQILRMGVISKAAYEDILPDKPGFSTLMNVLEKGMSLKTGPPARLRQEQLPEIPKAFLEAFKY